MVDKDFVYDVIEAKIFFMPKLRSIVFIKEA
jgi:hypothetical protein